jgi:hypothetical protein
MRVIPGNNLFGGENILLWKISRKIFLTGVTWLIQKGRLIIGQLGGLNKAGGNICVQLYFSAGSNICCRGDGEAWEAGVGGCMPFADALEVWAYTCSQTQLSGKMIRGRNLRKFTPIL